MKEAVCMECGEKAVWELAPSDSYGEYCDVHVPRGCSCNAMINPITGQFDGPEETDDSGRLLPCCEYDFHPEGFEPSHPFKVTLYKLRQIEHVSKKIQAELNSNEVNKDDPKVKQAISNICESMNQIYGAYFSFKCKPSNGELHEQ